MVAFSYRGHGITSLVAENECALFEKEFSSLAFTVCACGCVRSFKRDADAFLLLRLLQQLLPISLVRTLESLLT